MSGDGDDSVGASAEANKQPGDDEPLPEEDDPEAADEPLPEPAVEAAEAADHPGCSKCRCFKGFHKGFEQTFYGLLMAFKTFQRPLKALKHLPKCFEALTTF